MMSGACTGLDWCSDVNGLCAPVQKLQPDPANASTRMGFGFRVALSGSLAAIGAPRDDFSGAVYTFERQADGRWVMQASRMLPNPVADNSNYGSAVSMSGQRLLVGAHGQTDVAGAAYVFDRVGGQWVQQLKAIGPIAADRFGVAASLDGDRAIVGADDYWTNGAGAAYVFERQTDGSWPTSGVKLVASNPASSALFGTAVSISGDRVLIGSNIRAAYVFARQANGTWTEEQILTPTGGAAADLFGQAVSLVGDRALVGAAGDAAGGAGAGAVYVFERQSSGAWTQTATLRAPTPRAGAEFGTAVSQQGDRVIVGAERDRSNGTTVAGGAAYLYKRNSDGTWTAGVEIGSHPDDVISARQLGMDVAINGDFVLMGAWSDNAGPPIAGRDTGTAYVADMRSVLP